MSWHFTTDLQEFLAAAGPHLAAEPARNTALLTTMEGAELLGWWTGPDGTTATGALAAAPLADLTFGVVPVEAAAALVLPPGAEPATLRGETAAVEAYVAAAGRPWEPVVDIRLFRLDELTPQDPPPAGRSRPARTADLPLLGAWAADFDVVHHFEPRDDYTDFLTERITEDRLHVWKSPDGRPVAMAARSRTVQGQSRVHLVYTAPGERGRGYAAGVTATISRAAADSGAADVVLFTDLANTTSNALYPRLGYRPVADHQAVRFTDG
ncbi:GNAT family N-acetyltransferase [Streptomyces sp. R302]|uniref:GNAT family N-acetyltransferase n=1 Tax=unclassified Streptomyces TaxID=2593676 RepID=UPI00145E8AE7|nr:MULTISPECIES: GNAT family N-acetyltransferase [unclassified Streptomyces]NML49421.1 GNAT family N-acetyltransferase [Streptomyces sp. R301]NML77748.1 GNAT family N-acetyltransferase [Streptomyces sp. R302]